MFKQGRNAQSIQLAPPHFVRSLPRFAYSDGGITSHGRRASGRQLIAYMRTDEPANFPGDSAYQSGYCDLFGDFFASGG